MPGASFKREPDQSCRNIYERQSLCKKLYPSSFKRGLFKGKCQKQKDQSGGNDECASGIKEEVEYDIEIITEVQSYTSYNVVYENDTSLAPGTESVAQWGLKGCRSKTYRIISLNGQEISKELLSTDSYSPLNKIIKRGVSKTPAKPETPTTTTPEKPSTPETPSTPTKPETPTTPEKPSENNNTNNTVSNNTTGNTTGNATNNTANNTNGT